jgi:putative transposase
VCLRIPPKHGAGKVVGKPEGRSAIIPSGRHPEWRSTTGRDRTFWARGYYVSTVGLNEEVIKNYVRNQEEASRIE